jgi:RNA polymerase sigma-70 factor (ECF subfamily)
MVKYVRSMTLGSGDITVILQRWDIDRQSVVDALTPIVYRELHVIASAYLRRQRPDHTLQPTALVNEAYLRLVKQDSANLRDRSHFYALAARMMRQVLVDAARQRLAEKRGSGNNVPLDTKLEMPGSAKGADFLAIHEALDKLQAHDPRVAQVVELRYFGGLKLDEISEAMSISLATVKRELTLGVAWLRGTFD